MSHDKITSLAEPWILLPHVYAAKETGHISEYSSKLSKLAIDEFIDNEPESVGNNSFGNRDVQSQIREWEHMQSTWLDIKKK